MIALTRHQLQSCCGARRWVDQMAAAGPFRSTNEVLSRAEEIWWSLGPEDWHEAFASHPRIGDTTAGGRSAQEQRGVTNADPNVRAAIAEGNREYERRFGHIYLVSAAGKTAEELLAMLRSRLDNDPATELRVAAGEQAKITRLRLMSL
jgi:2-oxo-4-hydroxy-4-carboxy-5-ureidoimidazoline decarboxylase